MINIKVIRFPRVKLVFFKKAPKIDEILTIDLTLTTQCKIDSEDFVNFCGLLIKHELYFGVSMYDKNVTEFW